jgi:lipopolysaccharide assembly protein B
MILGNLYRQKGQVGRAINVHQALLQRRTSRTLEQAYVLLCLGLDFRHGGFVDRALEAFQEVLRLDPDNRYALVNLQKLHEDQHQWAEAWQVREQIARQSTRGAARGPADPRLPPQRDRPVAPARGRSAAAADFAEAIDTDARTAPAMAQPRRRARAAGRPARRGRRLGRARATRARSRPSRLRPPRACLGRARHAAPVRRAVPRAHRAAPADWRTRLALSRHLAATDGRARPSTCCSRRCRTTRTAS